MKIRILLIVLFTFVWFGTACRQSQETAVPPNLPPNPEIIEPETYTAQVNSYNLGEATVVQDHFPEDSRFRNMPVRLEGVIGVPESDKTHPVVLIMHGSHNVCGGEDVWPCAPEIEQRNYEGFTYLVEALAEAGYVALSINVNAEHTFAHGEAPPSVRTAQLIDLHLGELIAAHAGESDKFGVEVNGRVDPARMVWMGHSRGADFANWIIRQQNLETAASPVGYGPVDGVLLLAPPIVALDTLPTTDLPFSVILPACDGDVQSLSGQGFFESARFDSSRNDAGSSVYLEGANHNHFNTVLPSDYVNGYPENRPDCTAETSLSAEQQQAFLTQYTIDFLQALFAQPEPAFAAQHRLGLVASSPVPTAFNEFATRFNILPAATDRLLLIQPQSEAELSQNLLGGAVTFAGVDALFCAEGYYVPTNEPGTEPCKRVNINQPAYPQQFVLSWEAADAEMRMTIPETDGDLSRYTAVQLRAALDPLSELNSADEPQAFSVELVDTNGNRAQIVSPPIDFPIGVETSNDFFDGGTYTGHVQLTSLRLPLSEFEGIDLTQISEITLLFNQTESGTLFIADLELVEE